MSFIFTITFHFAFDIFPTLLDFEGDDCLKTLDNFVDEYQPNHDVDVKLQIVILFLFDELLGSWRITPRASGEQQQGENKDDLGGRFAHIFSSSHHNNDARANVRHDLEKTSRFVFVGYISFPPPLFLSLFWTCYILEGLSFFHNRIHHEQDEKCEVKL